MHGYEDQRGLIDTGGMAIPLLSIRRVWHVGTLNPADKACRGPSHEGHGLSVSTCPDAWIRIARLGGLPRWCLINPDARFVNFHRLKKSDWYRIRAWGIDHHLAVPATFHQVSWFDDDLERTVAMLCEDMEEARLEADDCEGEIQPVDGLAPTEKLAVRLGFAGAPALMDSYLAAIYAEEELGVDGVWWRDVLDVQGLSAPRGVIVPTRLCNWRAHEHPGPGGARDL